MVYRNALVQADWRILTITLPGVDSKPPLTVANVAMRFAQPKVMPVVTATAHHQPCSTAPYPLMSLTLPNEIEPPSCPREERRKLVVRCQYSRPVIRPSRGRDGARDLCHSQTNEQGEEAHTDPADGHHTRTASCQTIFEQCRDAGNHGNDGEGHAKVVKDGPVSFQFLIDMSTEAQIKRFDEEYSPACIPIPRACLHLCYRPALH